MNSEAQPKGLFTIEHRRNGEVINRVEVPNAVTTAGKNKMNDVMFRGATALSNWYIGLIDNSGYSATDVADTYTSHAGWSENEDYSQSTRPAWTNSASSAGVIATSTVSTFTIDDTCAIAGVFVASSNVKGETTGSAMLWSTGIFSGVRNLISGDTLNISYSLTLT